MTERDPSDYENELARIIDPLAMMLDSTSPKWVSRRNDARKKAREILLALYPAPPAPDQEQKG